MSQNIKLLLFIVLINNALCAQRRDSTIFFDYYVCSNLLSRIGAVGDIGVERIKLLKNNLHYASQFSVHLNKQSLNIKPVDKYYPKFFGFTVQPFHLLIGNRLQFETGPSVAFGFFRYLNNTKYPLDTSNFAYNTFHDRMLFMYTIGLRYTFKKPQLAVKFIIGPRGTVNLQRNQTTYFNFNPGAGELGISWRLRKSIRRKPTSF